MISAERLSKLKLFSGIPSAVLTRLGETMLEKTFAPGEFVIKEGERSGSLYLIARGSVSVQTRAKTVARLENEEFFGEMAFLSNEPHSASVVANDEAAIVILPRHAVDALIKREPSSAIDQMMTLFAAVSARLRRTTDEFVTIFDVARLIAAPPSFEKLIQGVLERLRGSVGAESTIAFYRWNPFNDEYALVATQGNDGESFPPAIEVAAPLIKGSPQSFENVPDIDKEVRPLGPLPFKKGHAVVVRSDGQTGREGLFLYYNEVPYAFDAGKRQLMESISAVMAPALESARGREEEAARARLERSKQTGTSL